MAKNLQSWAAHVRCVRPEVDEIAKCLEKYGAKIEPQETRQVDAILYIATFTFPHLSTTTRIYFQMQEYQTDSDVVITNMTTLPENHRRKGSGRKAVQSLLAWATENNFGEVRATQVGSDEFWSKCGFTRDEDPNPCNDFVYRVPTQSPPASEVTDAKLHPHYL